MYPQHRHPSPRFSPASEIHRLQQVIVDFRASNRRLVEDLRAQSAEKRLWLKEKEKMEKAEKFCRQETDRLKGILGRKEEAFQAQTQKTQETIESLKAQVADLETNTNLQKEHNQKLQLENTNLAASLKNTTDKVLQLEQQLATRDEDHSLQVRHLIQQLAEAEIRESDMAANTDKHKVLQLEQQLSTTEDNVLFLQSKVDDLTQQISEANQLNIDMTARLDQERKKVLQLEEQHANKMEEIQLSQEKTVGLMQQLAEASQLNLDMAARQDQENNKVLQLEQQIFSLEGQVADLTQRLAEAKQLIYPKKNKWWKRKKDKKEKEDKKDKKDKKDKEDKKDKKDKEDRKDKRQSQAEPEKTKPEENHEEATEKQSKKEKTTICCWFKKKRRSDSVQDKVVMEVVI